MRLTAGTRKNNSCESAFFRLQTAILSMIVFPNCKINLGLRILRKRNDGYHDLETFFYPLLVTDALEIVLTKEISESALQLSNSGIIISGEPNSNLCTKAYNLLRKDIPSLPSVLLHLHKTIPLGAGLGGGSSDAAFTLKLLNKIGNLNLSIEKLMDYALQLGSDCPFFILNKPCYATGRGEQLEEYPIDLGAYQILIVNPGIHVDTAKAFLNIKPGIPEKSIKEIINLPVNQWKTNLINDFETVVFNTHKEVADIKKGLYQLGAVYASLSGSGSSVYGIFEKEKIIEHSFPAHYFVRISNC